ncbi:hypothetical protein C9439_01510 [archaeon SCG-AAA382B04]|nr:hypothetical protein C9439_01510 [archaeon SCG-AAA382B04]
MKNKKTIIFAFILILSISIGGCLNQDTDTSQKVSPQSIGTLEKNLTLTEENASREIENMFPNITEKKGFKRPEISLYMNNQSQLYLYAVVFEKTDQASEAVVEGKTGFEEGFIMPLNLTQTTLDGKKAYTFSHAGADIIYWSHKEVAYSVINNGANMSMTDIVNTISESQG